MEKMEQQPWWKNSVIYQVYPKSYQDTNDDGYGDLPGIIQNLDKIKNLGTDVIWLSPIFCSPNKDNGYDISDYKNIDPKYGSTDDLKQLINKAHSMGIKILLDLVVNHCSEEHHWFQDAINNPNSQYHDYFFFRKGKSRNEPPNDWQSIFGGSAWTYVEKLDMFYLHTFASFQPDLNWDNEIVRNEVFQIVHYWMNMGVDGWRLDAIIYISKPPMIHNINKNKELIPIENDFIELKEDEEIEPESSYYQNLPENLKEGPNLHQYLQMLCSNIRQHNNSLIIGECAVDPRDIWKFVSPSRGELDMIITFEFVGLGIDYNKGCGKYALKDITIQDIRNVVYSWINNVHDGQIALHIQSHDQARALSRFGSEVKRLTSGKMLATYNQMMQGTPIVYQGEEIGMLNWPFELEEANDVDVKNYYKILVEDRHVYTKEQFLQIARVVSRDNARTPMQWNSEFQAGFSKGKPWLPINYNYGDINYKESMENTQGIYNYYKKLIQLRKNERLITQGKCKVIFEQHPHLLVYKRYEEGNKEEIWVICNFFDVKTELECEFSLNDVKFLVGNYGSILIEGLKKIHIRHYEAMVLRVRVQFIY